MKILQQVSSPVLQRSQLWRSHCLDSSSGLRGGGLSSSKPKVTFDSITSNISKALIELNERSLDISLAQLKSSTLLSSPNAVTSVLNLIRLLTDEQGVEIYLPIQEKLSEGIICALLLLFSGKHRYESNAVLLEKLESFLSLQDPEQSPKLSVNLQASVFLLKEFPYKNRGTRHNQFRNLVEILLKSFRFFDSYSKLSRRNWISQIENFMWRTSFKNYAIVQQKFIDVCLGKENSTLDIIRLAYNADAFTKSVSLFAIEKAKCKVHDRRLENQIDEYLKRETQNMLVGHIAESIRFEPLVRSSFAVRLSEDSRLLQPSRTYSQIENWRTNEFTSNLHLLKRQAEEQPDSFVYDEIVDIVHQSRDLRNSVPAGSAVTILNKSEFNFSQSNMNNIKAPGAFLAKSNLCNAKFINSDLRNSHFKNATLINTNFINANLLGIKFGKPKMLLGGPVTCLVSINEYVVSGHTNGSIKVWNVNSREIVALMQDLYEHVRCIDITKDSEWIVTGNRSGIVLLWDFYARSILKEFSYNDFPVNSVKFSPSKKVIVSASDISVFVINVSTGKVIQKITHKEKIGSYVIALEFSPNGKTLATASEEDHILLINDYMNANYTKKALTGHFDIVTCIAFSADGELLVSGSKDKSVKLWRNGKEVKQFSGHGSEIVAVLFGPSGKSLISADISCIVKIWNRSNGEKLQEFQVHNLFLTSMSLSLDGSRLYTGSLDGAVKLWKLRSAPSIPSHTLGICCLSFSPSGRFLVSGSEDKTVRVWEVPSGKPFNCLQGHSKLVSSVAFAGDGLHIVSGSYDETVRVWTYKGKQVHCLHEHTKGVTSVAVSPNSEIIVSGSLDQTMHIWHLYKGTRLKVLQKTGLVKSLAFAPNGVHVAIGCLDRKIEVWDIEKQEKITSFSHGELLRSVAYSVDGNYIASAGKGKSIRIWDAISGKQKTAIVHEEMDECCVAFTPDSLSLISAGNNGCVKLWDIESERNLDTYFGHSKAVFAVAVNPDGLLAASCGADKTIKLWELTDEDKLE